MALFVFKVLSLYFVFLLVVNLCKESQGGPPKGDSVSSNDVNNNNNIGINIDNDIIRASTASEVINYNADVEALDDDAALPDSTNSPIQLIENFELIIRAYVCIPLISEFIFENVLMDRDVTILSVSTSRQQFHAVLFQPQVLAPKQRFSINVLYLPDSVEKVMSNISMVTSDGNFTFGLRGESLPNPYRISPLVGYRVTYSGSSGDSAFEHSVIIYNPFPDTLQVLEVYTTEDFLVVSGAPLTPSFNSNSLSNSNSNKRGANSDSNNAYVNLWSVESGSESKIIELGLRVSQPDRYFGYLHIKTSRDSMVVPVDILVVEGGLKLKESVINFGTIIAPTGPLEKNSSPEVIEIRAWNLGLEPLEILDISLEEPDNNFLLSFNRSIILPPVNTDSGDEAIKAMNSESGSNSDVSVLIATVTLTNNAFESKSNRLANRLFIATNHSNMNFALISIEIQAAIIYGGVGFDRSQSLFVIKSLNPLTNFSAVSSEETPTAPNKEIHQLEQEQNLQNSSEPQHRQIKLTNYFNEPVLLKTVSTASCGGLIRIMSDPSVMTIADSLQSWPPIDLLFNPYLFRVYNPNTESNSSVDGSNDRYYSHNYSSSNQNDRNVVDYNGVDDSRGYGNFEKHTFLKNQKKSHDSSQRSNNPGDSSSQSLNSRPFPLFDVPPSFDSSSLPYNCWIEVMTNVSSHRIPLHVYSGELSLDYINVEIVRDNNDFSPPYRLIESNSVESSKSIFYQKSCLNSQNMFLFANKLDVHKPRPIRLSLSNFNPIDLPFSVTINAIDGLESNRSHDIDDDNKTLCFCFCKEFDVDAANEVFSDDINSIFVKPYEEAIEDQGRCSCPCRSPIVNGKDKESFESFNVSNSSTYSPCFLRMPSYEGNSINDSDAFTLFSGSQTIFSITFPDLSSNPWKVQKMISSEVFSAISFNLVTPFQTTNFIFHYEPYVNTMKIELSSESSIFNNSVSGSFIPLGAQVKNRDAIELFEEDQSDSIDEFNSDSNTFVLSSCSFVNISISMEESDNIAVISNSNMIGVSKHPKDSQKYVLFSPILCSKRSELNPNSTDVEESNNIWSRAYSAISSLGGETRSDINLYEFRNALGRILLKNHTPLSLVLYNSNSLHPSSDQKVVDSESCLKCSNKLQELSVKEVLSIKEVLMDVQFLRKELTSYFNKSSNHQSLFFSKNCLQVESNSSRVLLPLDKMSIKMHNWKINHIFTFPSIFPQIFTMWNLSLSQNVNQSTVPNGTKAKISSSSKASKSLKNISGKSEKSDGSIKSSVEDASSAPFGKHPSEIMGIYVRVFVPAHLNNAIQFAPLNIPTSFNSGNYNLIKEAMVTQESIGLLPKEIHFSKNSRKVNGFDEFSFIHSLEMFRFSMIFDDKRKNSAVVGDWREAFAPDGSRYYWNAVTRESRWDLPKGFSTAKFDLGVPIIYQPKQHQVLTLLPGESALFGPYFIDSMQMLLITKGNLKNFPLVTLLNNYSFIDTVSLDAEFYNSSSVNVLETRPSTLTSEGKKNSSKYRPILSQVQIKNGNDNIEGFLYNVDLEDLQILNDDYFEIKLHVKGVLPVMISSFYWDYLLCNAFVKTNEDGFDRKIYLNGSYLSSSSSLSLKLHSAHPSGLMSGSPHSCEFSKEFSKDAPSTSNQLKKGINAENLILSLPVNMLASCTSSESNHILILNFDPLKTLSGSDSASSSNNLISVRIDFRSKLSKDQINLCLANIRSEVSGVYIFLVIVILCLIPIFGGLILTLVPKKEQETASGSADNSAFYNTNASVDSAECGQHVAEESSDPQTVNSLSDKLLVKYRSYLQIMRPDLYPSSNRSNNVSFAGNPGNLNIITDPSVIATSNSSNVVKSKKDKNSPRSLEKSNSASSSASGAGKTAISSSSENETDGADNDMTNPTSKSTTQLYINLSSEAKIAPLSSSVSNAKSAPPKLSHAPAPAGMYLSSKDSILGQLDSMERTYDLKDITVTSSSPNNPYNSPNRQGFKKDPASPTLSSVHSMNQNSNNEQVVGGAKSVNSPKRPFSADKLENIQRLNTKRNNNLQNSLKSAPTNVIKDYPSVTPPSENSENYQKIKEDKNNRKLLPEGDFNSSSTANIYKINNIAEIPPNNNNKVTAMHSDHVKERGANDVDISNDSSSNPGSSIIHDESTKAISPKLEEAFKTSKKTQFIRPAEITIPNPGVPLTFRKNSKSNVGGVQATAPPSITNSSSDTLSTAQHVDFQLSSTRSGASKESSKESSKEVLWPLGGNRGRNMKSNNNFATTTTTTTTTTTANNNDTSDNNRNNNSNTDNNIRDVRIENVENWSLGLDVGGSTLPERGITFSSISVGNSTAFDDSNNIPDNLFDMKLLDSPIPFGKKGTEYVDEHASLSSRTNSRDVDINNATASSNYRDQITAPDLASSNLASFSFFGINDSQNTSFSDSSQRNDLIDMNFSFPSIPLTPIHNENKNNLTFLLDSNLGHLDTSVSSGNSWLGNNSTDLSIDNLDFVEEAFDNGDSEGFSTFDLIHSLLQRPQPQPQAGSFAVDDVAGPTLRPAHKDPFDMFHPSSNFEHNSSNLGFQTSGSQIPFYVNASNNLNNVFNASESTGFPTNLRPSGSAYLDSDIPSGPPPGLSANPKPGSNFNSTWMSYPLEEILTSRSPRGSSIVLGDAMKNSGGKTSGIEKSVKSEDSFDKLMSGIDLNKDN